MAWATWFNCSVWSSPGMNLRTVMGRPARRSTSEATAAVTRCAFTDCPRQAGLPVFLTHR